MSVAVSQPGEPAFLTASQEPQQSRTKNKTNTEVALPELRSSEQAVDRSRPLPTSLQSDFLPDDVLLAITQPPSSKDKLGPPTRFRNLNTSTGNTRKPPASIWNFPKRRERFKHLTENTACVCGAGKDISFLYDVPKEPDPLDLEQPSKYDSSGARLDERGTPRKSGLKLPDTLIPDEYHIVKNKGVLGLEYRDEKYTTQPDEHEKHLVMFPSLNPSSRYEVMQLKKTMETMLLKAGIEDEDREIKGPTQMHNLLELIKKEQDIYNLVFHELIRQTSVECVERGELLSELRSRYSDLLNKVPRQIKSLHEEVMAQRALDRRLTEELMRFKSTISILTNELSAVKEHDRLVTDEARRAQNDLKSALAESQKNAGLLAEYHDLYELQRKRMEKQVTLLADEKELWSTAAYSLALKVTQEHSLNTAQRLHTSEKSWSKLASHFVISLGDKDTEMLTQLQGYVERWHDVTEEFHADLLQRDNKMKEQLRNVRVGINKWVTIFQNEVFNKDGLLERAPDTEMMTELYGNLKDWEETLAEESEMFGGDALLTGQDTLNLIRRLMYAWTDCSLKVFNRHRSEDGKPYPDHDYMLSINQEVEVLLNQFHVRLTGENGAARGIIHLMNSLESWDNRLNTALHGSTQIPEAEWTRFYQLLDDWVQTVEEAIDCLGLTQREEDRNDNKPHTITEVSEMIKRTQKWLSSTTNGIDSEDAKLSEQVASLHTDMVKWMVQILLRLAPDQKENSIEANQMALLGSTSVSKIKSGAEILAERLDSFSKYVFGCCEGFVSEEMQKKLDEMAEDADKEFKDLTQLKSEAAQWIYTSRLLLSDLTGEPMKETKPQTSGSDISQTPQPSQETAPLGGLTPTPQPSDVAPPSEKTETPQPSQTAETTPKPTEESETTEPQQTASDEQTTQEQVDEQAPDGAAPTDSQAADQAAGDTAEQSEEQKTAEQETAEEEKPEAIEFIGHDANTHVKKLPQETDQPPQREVIPLMVLPGAGDRPETPNTKRAFEALAAVTNLQDQLLATEERAQKAEERASNAEAELKSAMEKLRALERHGSQSTPSEEKPPSVVSFADSTKTQAKPHEDGKKDKRPDSQVSKSSKSSKSSKKK